MNLKDRTRWAINFIAKKEKLSNPKIGNIIGVKADTVNSYRSKLANPKVDFIIKFCDTFGIDLLWFTKGEGEPFPGANAKFPEVCTPSRYETHEFYDSRPPTSPEPSFPASASVEDENSEKYIVINSTEKSLVALSKMIGISITRGWKSGLADFLAITPAQLSNTISRDRISKNLLIKIEEKGYPADKWLIRNDTNGAPEQYAETDNIAVEISFQKLAILAGIRVDGSWVLNLSHFLGTEPWHISMCIYNNRIDPHMLHIIETKGFAHRTWAVKRSGPPMPSVGKTHRPTNSELLKMAEAVLQSGTTHATSLAMGIISLSTAVSADKKIP